MLKVHDRVFMEKSEEFNNDVSGLLQEIKADITDEELRARFEKRVPEVNIVMIDGLTENMEGNWGLYEEDTNRIKIAQQVPERWLKHTLTHEIMHALEGKKIMARKIDRDYPTDLPEYDIHITKGGLVIGNQFSWLNEAITENITTEILNEEGSQYQSERDLLSLLFASGSVPIDFSLFRKAYFEDYDPEHPKGKRMPHHQALIDAVDSAYTKGFLAKLNYYVVKHGDRQHPEIGVQAAINVMKTDWRNIVNSIPTASNNSLDETIS